MENNSSNPSPQKPEISEKEKIGSLVERLRSYESDIARLKGVSLEPKITSRPAGPSIAEPESARRPFEIAGKPPPSVSNPGNTFKTLEEAKIVAEPEKPKENPQETIDALHKETPIQQSRTIQTDIMDNSKEHSTTIADIIRAEEEKNRVRPREVNDPKRSAYILTLSAVLLVGGLLAFGVFYAIKTAPNNPTPAPSSNPNVIIETKTTRDVILEQGLSVVSAMTNLRKEPAGNQGDIIGINFKESTSTSLTGELFARRFSDRMPAFLVRSFQPLYLAGLYSSGKSWQPFMLFKLTDYNTAYSGMLSWEETMPEDFAGLIPNSINVASSTNTNPVFKTGFRDTVIKNKDVRVFQDALGHKLIFYSFPDNDTLVITTDQATLEAIFARLTTSKFVQ